MIRFRAQGISQTRAAVSGLARRAQNLQEPIWQSLMLLERDMKQYPPPPGGSTYVRTGRLGGSWLSQASNREGVLQTNVEYAIWVQSQEYQAWMHRGRWRTDAQAVEDRLPAIVQLFYNYLRRGT